MSDPTPPRKGRLLAYVIASLTTVLWLLCVLPSGVLGPDAVGLADDMRTPMHREATLLVPALLLLIIMPVGIVLAEGKVGRLAVLAGGDAFVAGYFGLLLAAQNTPRGDLALGLVVLMLMLAGLSAYEMIRVLRRGADVKVGPLLKGLRLAICILVLLVPASHMVVAGKELASLLVPFVIVGVSAAGALFATAPLGLRFTASAVHALLAVHIVVTLRYAIFDSAPRFSRIDPFGYATIGLAGFILFLALVQVLVLWRLFRHSRAELAVQPAPQAGNGI